MCTCVTLHHHITARWPHICGKKFPQTSICTSPKAQSGGKTGVFSISAIQQICCESDEVIYRSRHRTKKLTRAPSKRLTSTFCWQRRRPTMTVLGGCDIIFWERNISKILDFQSRSDTLLPSVQGCENWHRVDKMCRFRVSKHTSSVSVAKISSQQWQHFESTQTQQQNSRMWLKSSQWSHTEAKITWSVTQCYLQFISTLLLPSKTKRWDAHACLQSWRIYFSTFRMNCSTF